MADFSIEQTIQHAYTLGSMTTTMYTQVMTFVERAPLPISQLWNISYSLDNPSWMFLLVSCFLVTLLLYVISIFEEKYKTSQVRGVCFLIIFFPDYEELDFGEHITENQPVQSF